MRVKVRQLCFGYEHPLFDGLDAEFDVGWTGVVGGNGAGKSTLLRLVAKRLTPERGRIEWQPSELRVAYCEQGVQQAGLDVEAFAWDYDRPALRLRERLELDPEALSRWDVLSPGERKRWQVGAALSQSPDLLLLDEPTNHLDERATELLFDALRAFPAIGLIVSHDRALLDALTTRTLRVDAGKADCLPLPYGAANEQWGLAREHQREEHARLLGRKKALRASLTQTRHKQAASQAQVSAGKRMKGPKDSDGRSMGRTNLAQAASRRFGQDIKSTSSKLERVQQELDGFELRRQLGSELFADYEPATKRILFHLERKRVSYGTRTILRDVSCQVQRDDKVWLAGPNGSGKSTLLRALVASARHAERFLYLPQEFSDAELDALRREVNTLDNATKGRVLQLVGAQGTRPAQVLSSSSWSPGEARKLALALALCRRVWGLVLDEPTNHLDLPSIERLEQLLAAFPGALVLVSHDSTLAQRVTRQRWEVVSGDLRITSSDTTDDR